MANLSQQKRERMLALLNKIKAEHQDDDETLQALDEIETELNSKKYGLVWEKHEEEVDRMMQDNIPVFTEVKEREIKATDENAYNFLLEGDNLHSLKLLEKTHAGKIDVIYIDPPYNTKSKEFIYDDYRIGEDDAYRHSKWLSFMNERLEIAKRLLSDESVLFISIDDNEIAQLKLLCDEIFGMDNFLGIIIQNKLNAKNDTLDIQKNHEYIVTYRKKSRFINGTKVLPTLVRKEKKLRPVYKENGRYYYVNDSITTRGEGGVLSARPNLGYTVYFNPSTGVKKAVSDYDISLVKESNDENIIYKHSSDLLNDGYVAIIPPKVRGKLGCWTWSLEKFNAESDNIVITGKAGRYTVKKRTFVPEESVENISGSLFYSSIAERNSRSIIEYSTNDGTNTLSAVMGRDATFSNPKNLSMIEYLLSIYVGKNPTILDFFAGSGTTAQAVLELNKEDGGNRKFILCTNNENNICEEVTYERIKSVINGYADVEGIPANLKYFKTDFVSKDTDDVSSELLEHIKEMVELENGITLDNKHYLIVLNDEQADALAKNWSRYEDIRAIYVSRDVLLTTEQQACFAGAEIHVIPDYYFEYELKEVGEAW